MWSKLESQAKSSCAVEVDFLDFCKHDVRIIEDFANRGDLLNQRQCQDLSFKLSKINLNIQELLLRCGASAALFTPAVKNLYPYLEKAKVLVSECGDKDWCTAAVFQIQNENALREILLDVSLCYNAIYEQAKSTSEDCDVLPEDLRLSSIFKPIMESDVLLDQQDLQKRLEDLANAPRSSKLLDRFLTDKEALKHYLARYLLVKLNFAAKQSQASTLDTCSEILWARESEPPGTWGKKSIFLGAGSGASGVCNTKWMGIPCAKKEFHPQDAEIFFLKEAGILAYLNHPCIVNFFCCGNGLEKGDRFIAMEHMEKSLFDLIEEQKQKRVYFPLLVVVDMMVQIARGMCYLHGGGIAHRDLKPSNVVVNRLTSLHLLDHYYVKLVDFGMSKTKVEVSKSNTMTALGIGTTMYRAPEAHPDANRGGQGKANWFQADVFSFAMTFSHLMSLKTPFKDMLRPRELYNGLMNGRRPELPEDCPHELVALLRDCWDTKPSSRPSFIEICTRLESFQYKLSRGFPTFDQGSQEEMDSGRAFEFIEAMMEEQLSIQKPFVHGIDDVAEGEVYDSDDMIRNDVVATILCPCTRSLQLLHQSAYDSKEFVCNICWLYSDREVYHCETCQFDAHPDCAEIKDEVTVFFHGHPLHLQVQNYHDNNPDVICGFCEEPLQGSEWVYTCRQCNLYVHALCTKHPWEVNNELLHLHRLTLVQSAPRKNSSCNMCCNGDLKGFRYSCTQKRCSFDLHPSCFILPTTPLCIFGCQHRLSLDLGGDPRGFLCGRCGALGYSYFYHCLHCDVSIHLDCVNDMDEEEDDRNGAYDRFMLEYEEKADHDKMDAISELLDIMLVSSGLEMSSSSCSRLPPVIVRVQPTIQMPTASSETSGSIAFDDMNIRKMIAVETEERKAMKRAAKAARLKVRAKLMAEQPGKVENLEILLQALQSSKIDAEVLAATREKLKKIFDFVQKVTTSKMRQVPRIGLICDYYYDYPRIKLLTSFPAEMSEVKLLLLCEEPGHEHVVRLPGGSEHSGCYVSDMVREEVEKLWQPLLASGLQVVRMALSRATDITALDCVTLPILSGKPSNLQDIALEKHGIQTKLAKCQVEENVDLHKTSEDTAAEMSLLSYLEDNEVNIFDRFGLLRVRYTATEQGSCPQYKQGTVAWLCTEHRNRGREAGILEPYPLRIYHNLEYNQKRGFL